jgi:hypothetical protein
LENEIKKSNLAKVSDQLDDLDKKLNELKAKASSYTDTVKADYEKIVDELQRKKKEAEAHLERLKTASNESWKELKKGTEKTIDSMNKTIKKALAKFKK